MSVPAEPFQRLINQGMILGEMEFWTDTGGETRVNRQRKLKNRAMHFVLKNPIPRFGSTAGHHKMSKSRGNVVNPDEIVRDYGADSLRMYEMFMGPLEQSKPWNMQRSQRQFGDSWIAPGG